MCGYFCIGFIDVTSKSKSLLDYGNLFFANDYEKNDKIFVICGKYRKYEKPNIPYLLGKTLVLAIICSKCKSGVKNLDRKIQIKQKLI